MVVIRLVTLERNEGVSALIHIPVLVAEHILGRKVSVLSLGEVRVKNVVLHRPNHRTKLTRGKHEARGKLVKFSRRLPDEIVNKSNSFLCVTHSYLVSNLRKHSTAVNGVDKAEQRLGGIVALLDNLVHRAFEVPDVSDKPALASFDCQIVLSLLLLTCNDFIPDTTLSEGDANIALGLKFVHRLKETLLDGKPCVDDSALTLCTKSFVFEVKTNRFLDGVRCAKFDKTVLCLVVQGRSDFLDNLSVSGRVRVYLDVQGRKGIQHTLVELFRKDGLGVVGIHSSDSPHLSLFTTEVSVSLSGTVKGGCFLKVHLPLFEGSEHIVLRLFNEQVSEFSGVKDVSHISVL